MEGMYRNRYTPNADFIIKFSPIILEALASNVNIYILYTTMFGSAFGLRNM